MAGSCSAATLRQIEEFINSGGKAIKIEPLQLLSGTLSKEDLWKEIQSLQEEKILIYSSDRPEKVKEAQEAGMEKISAILESTTAYIAKKAVENGFFRVIVAGGETSGAVTRILGYNAYYVGDSIAPGVPIMVPVENKKVRLVLKSGNFGDKDFFIKAVEMTRGDING